jgi:3-hydroxyisobutyrate dehydrogenase-like beta-hydroxyacid dehydrogenase
LDSGPDYTEQEGQLAATIAVIAPGAMGSAVGRRLAEHGARVLTLLEGRSEPTAQRARAAGMIGVAAAELTEADLILSIVPPGEALGLAASLAPVLRQSRTKPAFVDCNAINPDTMKTVAAALADTGCAVLDGAIIGGPPAPGRDGPTFYVSGDPDRRAGILSALGLKLRHIDGPLGGASALKMVYGGINKGTIALGAAMLLAAVRAGCAPGLRQEMSESVPEVLARFTDRIPDMYPKAYRWVAEMREIAAFLGPDDPAAQMFDAAARVFARVAEDRAGSGALAASLNGALGFDDGKGVANAGGKGS